MFSNAKGFGGPFPVTTSRRWANVIFEVLPVLLGWLKPEHCEPLRLEFCVNVRGHI